MPDADSAGIFPDARCKGRLAVVIPAYNEAATIAAIVRRCRHIPGLPRVFVVDDGSSDDTAAIAAQHGAAVLRNTVNLGKGTALMRGMRAAMGTGADYLVTLDGDGQHRPEDVPRLLAAARAWPDRIVLGSRRNASSDAPRARVVANRIADFWISWAARHPIDDSQCGFRLYPFAALRRLSEAKLARGFAFESEVLIEAARAGYRTVSVAIPAIYGGAMQRPSHFRPVIDITRIVLMVAGKLLSRAMDPAGLWQSIQQAPARWADSSPISSQEDQESMIVARPDTSTCPLAERSVKP